METFSLVTEHPEEWHEKRSSCLGGSDLGSILGLTPWACRRKVFYEKQAYGDAIKSRHETVAMRRGSLLEGQVVRWLLEMKPTLSRANFKPKKAIPKDWAGGNPDAILFENFSGRMFPLEVKLRAPSAIADIVAYGEPDEATKLQAAYYAYVYGFKSFGIVYCNSETFELHYFKEDLTQELIDRIHMEADKFWDELAYDRTPPALPIGSPPCYGCEFAKDCHSKSFNERNDGVESTNEEIADLILQHETVKAEAKALTDLKKDLKNKIVALMSGHDMVYCPDGCKASNTMTEKKIVDLKALRAAHPEIVEEFETISVSETFRTAKPKGE